MQLVGYTSQTQEYSKSDTRRPV